MRFFGINFVGVSAENGKKLLLTIILVFAVYFLRLLFTKLLDVIPKLRRDSRAAFWADQALRLTAAAVVIVGVLSIWFTNPEHLVTAGGLVGAGIAFALQKVITALAAYFVLLRGRTFNVGDRITMGGVRGDVIALGFIQTTIMEMGEPPAEQADAPGMWVRARQYTGRVVTVTNDKIFDQPVYNYSREFPFIWEEMDIPISYKDDRQTAERILLEVAEADSMKITEMSEPALREFERRYMVRRTELTPRVFYRITDNWIEMSLRFMSPIAGTRELKDRMSRHILERFDQAGIGIASGTYEVVGFPPIKLETVPPPEPARSPAHQNNGGSAENRHP
jgi:small-conductance mechanosensitive channel